MNIDSNTEHNNDTYHFEIKINNNIKILIEDKVGEEDNVLEHINDLKAVEENIVEEINKRQIAFHQRFNDHANNQASNETLLELIRLYQEEERGQLLLWQQEPIVGRVLFATGYYRYTCNLFFNRFEDQCSDKGSLISILDYERVLRGKKEGERGYNKKRKIISDKIKKFREAYFPYYPDWLIFTIIIENEEYAETEEYQSLTGDWIINIENRLTSYLDFAVNICKPNRRGGSITPKTLDGLSGVAYRFKLELYCFKNYISERREELEESTRI